MSSSTWVYLQKLTKFWQIYKANCILFTEVWERMLFVIYVLCGIPGKIIFYQVIIFGKIAVFTCSIKTHWNIAEKPLKIICAVSLVGGLQAGKQLRAWIVRWTQAAELKGPSLVSAGCAAPAVSRKQGGERKVMDLLQEGQELDLVKVWGDSEGLWTSPAMVVWLGFNQQLS